MNRPVLRRGFRDYTYRDTPPACDPRQLTREGVARAGLADPALAARHWYVLRTAPRQEMRATLLLERAGHAVLYPRRRVFRRVNRYSRAKDVILKPLTVGYLFAGFVAPAPNWFDVLACQSLAGVVGIGGRPWCLGWDRVQRFMAGVPPVDAPEAHRHMRTHLEFAEGDVVEVLAGPLRGEHVRVETIEGRQAVAVLTLFGGQVPMRTPLDNLAALA